MSFNLNLHCYNMVYTLYTSSYRLVISIEVNIEIKHLITIAQVVYDSMHFLFQNDTFPTTGIRGCVCVHACVYIYVVYESCTVLVWGGHMISYHQCKQKWDILVLQ